MRTPFALIGNIVPLENTAELCGIFVLHVVGIFSARWQKLSFEANQVNSYPQVIHKASLRAIVHLG